MDFTKLDGLIPAVIQDAVSNEVLMVGFMNEEAWAITQRTGYVTFYSRTRNTLWTKGETSGHTLEAKEIYTDCDVDTVVIKAVAHGPGVCHEGYESCFFRTWQDGDWVVTEERKFDPQAVYGGSK